MLQNTELIEKYALPLGPDSDLSFVSQKLSQSKIVMLGESSHGTQEFYEWRRRISQDLIENHGFDFIVVEGDWPACTELNRYIQSRSDAKNVQEALKGFKRWPTWMWANTEIIKLAEWMKDYNTSELSKKSVDFYGLDVYSLFESIDEVVRQVQEIDSTLAQKIQSYYECFEPFERDERSYARSLWQMPEGCEEQVLQALKDLLHVRLDHVAKTSDQLFDAQQNARIIKNAENYYRTMINGREDSWNVRDRHMMETLSILLSHYGPQSKGIVWAHNTHIGDYRATNMVQEGQINIGGLARQQWGDDCVTLLGFGTYEGHVIASSAWDGPIQTMAVPPGRPESYEELFHAVSKRLNANAFFLWLKDDLKESDLSQILGHRAIGVVYNPAYERFGNYVPTSLSNRYDAFIFIDKTIALTPLKQKPSKKDFPETWPQGL